MKGVVHMSDYKEVFDDKWTNYGFGGTGADQQGSETRSGPGSTLENTVSVRNKIKEWITEHNWSTMIDIPCGDFNWMKHIVYSFQKYIGGDIVSRAIEENTRKYGNETTSFVNFDILTDNIPEGDVLLVRDIVGHFPLSDGEKIVQTILASKCKYLISTTWYNVNDPVYHERHINQGTTHGHFYPVNLMSAPFNFPAPMDFVVENVEVRDHDAGNRKILGLWKLEDIHQHLTSINSPLTTNHSSVAIDTQYQSLSDKGLALELYFAGLARAFGQHGIKSVVDTRCHDFNWFNRIVYMLDTYTGITTEQSILDKFSGYVNAHIQFQKLNIWTDNIPACDLLHLGNLLDIASTDDALKLLTKITNSNVKYISATTTFNAIDSSYNVNYKNDENSNKNLHATPYSLPPAVSTVEFDVDMTGYDSGNRIGCRIWSVDHIRQVLHPSTKNSTENLTLVTGLWNINRPGRDFSHYIENFKKFLEIPANMFIYIPAELEYLVWEKRDRKNTHVRHFALEDIKNNFYAQFWDKTQEIRTNDAWLNQTGESGWLTESPQAKLEWYNPIVQSKMFMLHDAKVLNPFETDYFLWLDAGITNTVYEKYFTDYRCFDKIIPHLSTFLFLSYPYEANNEIHGFNFDEINRFARQKVTYVCRGGLFGGHKDYISSANGTYHSLLQGTLHEGLMGTEESIFSIMAHLEPHLYKRYELDGNGLIVKFVQALIDDTVEIKGLTKLAYNMPRGMYDKIKHKTSLYVLSFNFPEQFRELIRSMERVPLWLERPRKILINNSNDQIAIARYDEICKEFGFEHIITGENLGINRGRIFAARHFHLSDSDYYFFFEDDMMLHPPEPSTYCRNGFRQFVPGLYEKAHHIMAREQFDFLKLSYTEVYMDNNIQVSWYNVPQSVRTALWPDYDQLPVSGLDPCTPRTKFDKIETFAGISYATGHIYYANWPMIVSREGNQKMFLDVQWNNPFEQTWMSYIFQETVKGNINPAVLLASPINHNRIHHYTPDERREN